MGVPEPRDAASVIVVDGERFLMGRRAGHHRFMPNVWVFPGGGIDTADRVAQAASPPTAAVVAAIGDPVLVRALTHAAARELAEEVGLSLGEPPHLGPLNYLCRAITPADRPIRFDARFFVVEARHVTGQAAGGAELEAPAWLTMAEALARDIPLATRAVLGQLERWRAAPRGWRPPVLREREWAAT